MSEKQPPWNIPARDAEEPVLKIFNSFTRSKVGKPIAFVQSGDISL